MDLSSIGNGISNWLSSNIGMFLLLMGYIVQGLIALAVVVGIYFLLQYKYKIVYHEVRLNPDMQLGMETTLTTKPKKDMARILNVKGIEKWRLLFARKDIEPVPFKYIMPKNVVNMIRTAPGAFLPCLPQKKFVMGNHTIDYYTPLNTDIKFWEQMELKQAALETMTPGEAKKMMIIAGVVIVGMLIFTGLMIYFNLQAAQKSVAHIDILSNAVSNLAKGVPA